MYMRLVTLVLVLALALAPVLVACGGGSSTLETRSVSDAQQSSVEAQRLCTGAADSYSGEVVAAFAMTVDDVRAVMPTAPPGGEDNYPDEWESLSGDVASAKCYIDADIPKAPPPELDGNHAPHFDRALIYVADGVPLAFQAAGYRDRLVPEPPQSARE